MESSRTKGLCTDPIETRTSSPVKLGRFGGCFVFSGAMLRLSPRCNVSRRGKWTRNIKRVFNVNKTSLTTSVRIERPIGPNAFCIDVGLNRRSERLKIRRLSSLVNEVKCPGYRSSNCLGPSTTVPWRYVKVRTWRYGPLWPMGMSLIQSL